MVPNLLRKLERFTEAMHIMRKEEADEKSKQTWRIRSAGFALDSTA